MTISRKTTGLNPVQITPARITPAHSYSGPADQSATRALIEGLGRMSENVARLGGAYAGYQERQKDDPEKRRLAKGRVQLESLRAGNDPAFAVSQYKAAPEDSVDRQTWAEQAGANYLEQSRDRLLKLSMDRGIENVDWNAEIAKLADEGVKGGLLPDDRAAQAFSAGATNLLNELKVGGLQKQGANAEYDAQVGLHVQTQNNFVDTLVKDGAPAAQKQLDALYSDPQYQKLDPQKKDTMLLNTIQGIVRTGGMRALNALKNIDGPDGRALTDRYSAEWPIWEKNAIDNARTLVNGEIRDAEKAVGGGTFQQQIEEWRGLKNDVVKKTVMAPEMVKGLMAQYKDRITQLDASGELGQEGKTLDDLREEAQQFATQEGYLDPADGLQAFNAQWDAIKQGFEKQHLTQVANDAALKQNTIVSGALRNTLETALKDGPDAAAKAVEQSMVKISAFQGKTFSEQVGYLKEAAQVFANEGNTKALEAMAKIKVNNDGQTFDKAVPALEWQKLQADLNVAVAAKEKARVTPLIEKLDTYALTGEIPASVLTEATDAGVSPKQILEAQVKAEERKRTIETENDKKNADAFKTRFFLEQSAQDADLLSKGRGDLLGDIDIPNPFNPDKTIKVTPEERFDNAMDRLDPRIKAEVDAEMPNASPEEKLVKRQVKKMQVYARNGEVDPLTKKNVQSLARKVQADGYTIGEDDKAQLRDLMNSVEVYGIHRVKDFAGTDREKDFLESVVLGIKSGDSEEEAIRSARMFREATPEQIRSSITAKELRDATANVLERVGGEGDPLLPDQVSAMVTKKMRLGASQSVAEGLVVKELQDTRAQVGGRWINIAGLKGASSPQQVEEVLSEAVDYYKSKFPDAEDQDITFRVDPKNGTLVMIDNLLGAPINANARPIRWSDILASFNQRVDEPRRKAAQEEGRKAAAEAFASQQRITSMENAEPEAVAADRRIQDQQRNPAN